MAKPKIYIDGKEGTTGLQIYDRLAKRGDIELLLIDEAKRKDTEERRKLIHAADIVFLCLPDAAAVEAVALAEGSGARIIDASTAHRTAKGWAYGMAELSKEHREAIKTSSRVANPGCHATGFITSVYPLVAQGIIPKDYPMTVFSLTGYSGGGKKMIGEYESDCRDALMDAPRMYGLSQQHKHLPEITALNGLECAPIFCPIVSDYYCGMETIIPLFGSDIHGTMEDIRNAYREFYTGPLVYYKEDADENGFVSANTMSGRDDMELSLYGNSERLLLVARFDNLGKGASGSAIQNLNLMMGAPETTGLVLGGER